MSQSSSSSSSSSSASSSSKANFYQILGHCPPGMELRGEDIISAVQFEKLGDYLAIGDRGGRVVIFEKDDRNTEPSYPQNILEGLDSAPAQGPKFRYKSEFMSHGPELEVSSYQYQIVTKPIKKVSWCVAENNGLPLLLAADKNTVKLWEFEECKTGKNQLCPYESRRFFSSENVVSSGQETLITSLSREYPFHAKCTSAFAHPRPYDDEYLFHIVSLSTNSDAETFISADKVTIISWNLEDCYQSFKIIDLNTPEQYTQDIITVAELHPENGKLLAYGSSRGVIRVIDLRHAASHDRSEITLVNSSIPRHDHFDRMVSGICDVKFLVGQQQLISRDYMSLKLWDMRKDSCPVVTFSIQDHLRPKLRDVYLAEHIFDPFECCCSRDGLSFASGSCSNRLKIFSAANATVEDIKMDVIGNRESYKTHTLPGSTVRRSPTISNTTTTTTEGGFEEGDELDCDFNASLLHASWHPTSNVVATAVKSSLILYHV